MCGGIDIGCDFEEVKTNKDIANEMGFEICEWTPEPDDKCESCGKENVQLWYHQDACGEGHIGA